MSNVLTENEAAAVAAFSKMTEDAAKIADQYKAMAKTYEATLKLAEQYKAMLKPIEPMLKWYENQAKIYRGVSDIQESVTSSMKAIMGARGLKQSDLASALGLSASTISQKMTKRVAWTLDDIEKASEFFKVNPEALVAGHGFEPWTSGLLPRGPKVQIHEATPLSLILAA